MNQDIKNLRNIDGEQNMLEFMKSAGEMISKSAATIVIGVIPKGDGFTIDIRFWEGLEEAGIGINPQQVLAVAHDALGQKGNSHLN